MFILTFTLFILSFLGIVLLLAAKRWEVRTNRHIAQVLRERVDERARTLKEQLARVRHTSANIVPVTIVTTRYLVRIGALSAARGARFLEVQSRRLADFVSHKHRFERRETKSDFLRQVGERNTDSGLDA